MCACIERVCSLSVQRLAKINTCINIEYIISVLFLPNTITRPASHCELNEKILTNTNNNNSERIGTDFGFKCSWKEICNVTYTK